MTDPRNLNQQLLRITRGALDACNQELERIAIARRSPKDKPDWMDPAEIERVERQLHGDKAELEQHLDWLLVTQHFATLRAVNRSFRYGPRSRNTLRAAS